MALVQNTLFSMIGLAVSAATPWVSLVLVGRFGGLAEAGALAMAQSLTQPVLLVASLQLRAVLWSAAGDRFAVVDFRRARILSLLGALSVCGLLTPLAGAPVFFVVAAALSRAADLAGEIDQAVLERQGQFARSARLGMGRAAVGVGSLMALLAGGVRAEAALSVAAALSMIPVGLTVMPDGGWAGVFRDRPAGRRSVVSGGPVDWRAARQLMAESWPLGFAIGLLAVQSSLPRLALARDRGPAELGLYALAALVPQALLIAASGLGQALAHPLARLFRRQEGDRFRLLLDQATASTVAALGLIAIGLKLGRPEALDSWLRLLGIAPSAEARDLVVLQIAGAALTAAAALQGFALTAAGDFRAQAGLFAPLAVLAALLSATLVPAGGLRGAALTVMLVAAAQWIISAWRVRILSSGMVRRQTPLAAPVGAES